MKKEISVLERQEHYAELLLLYRNLLTGVTLRRMEAFYFDNLSLGEIAENEKVSRNAVHLSIQSGEKELDHVEEAIGFGKKRVRMMKLVNQLEETEDENKRTSILEQLKGEIENGI